MPRHPPYTLSSLITFIGHRHLRFVARNDYFGYPSGRDENGRLTPSTTPSYRDDFRGQAWPTLDHHFRRKGARHSSGSDGKTKIQDPVQCRVSSYFKETLNLYSLVKDQPCSGHPPLSRQGLLAKYYVSQPTGVLSEPRKQRRRFSAPPLRFQLNSRNAI